jgi:hypothetical protein
MVHLFKRSLIGLTFISFFGSKIGLHLKPQAVSRPSCELSCGHVIASVSCDYVRYRRRGNMRSQGRRFSSCRGLQGHTVKKG